MTTPKKKMRRRLSVVDMIIGQTKHVRGMVEDLSRKLLEQFSGVFGMLHEIKNDVRTLRDAGRNGAAAAGDLFRPAQKVTVWLIAEPDPPRTPLYAGAGRTMTDPLELAAALYELTQRVHTLGQTGRIAVLTFDPNRGALELHARERIQS